MKCRDCGWNDDLLCDKYGVLISDDDECDETDNDYIDANRREPGNNGRQQDKQNLGGKRTN